MKWWVMIAGLLYVHFANLHAQQIPAGQEQQLESMAAQEEEETEDDSYWQEMERFRQHPLSLNKAVAADLIELGLLTELQVNSFITYRNMFGAFLSIYELQAIPLWDIYTIRKILPFIVLTDNQSAQDQLRKRFRNGEQILLWRVSQVAEKSKGYDNSLAGTKYMGSPQRLFFRYRYNYKNLLQFGVTADKDAGEPFLKGAQRFGFDFYSFHFFARRIGIIKSLAIGDFSVNMGQGLVIWQSMAFKKNAEVMLVKRQSPVFKPYNSAGEINFHRGAAITIGKGGWEASFFISGRKLSSNLIIDSSGNADHISSFQTSGYHRTIAEIADRNNLQQFAMGTNMTYSSRRLHLGINSVYYHFSIPLQKSQQLYNLYAIKGKQWCNSSIDYSYTYKNIHFFGEAAIDKNYHPAFVNGLLLSAATALDISVLYRWIAKDYQAVQGNAFTENTYPTNEKGIYAGISIKPSPVWRLDAYADLYSFPWLRYGDDAPGYGRDYLVQLMYKPSKQFELYTRFRNEAKSGNDDQGVINYPGLIPKKNWRIHVNYMLNSAWTIRQRTEMVIYDGEETVQESGFLLFMDLLYAPLQKRLSGAFRFQYFETDGYNSRLYAYENDVLFSYSVPVFYQKGYRFYIMTKYNWNKNLRCWLRLSRSVYPGKTRIGSGLDEIAGENKTEFKLQLEFKIH